MHTDTHILLKYNPRIHTSCSKTDTQAVAVSLGPLTFYQHFPTLLTCSFKMTHLQSWRDTCKPAHPDVLTETFRWVGDRWRVPSVHHIFRHSTRWPSDRALVERGKERQSEEWVGQGKTERKSTYVSICGLHVCLSLSGRCVCVCVCGFNLESFVCVRVCLWLCEWFQAALTEPSPQADPC